MNQSFPGQMVHGEREIKKYHSKYFWREESLLEEKCQKIQCPELNILLLLFLSDPSPIIGNACHSLTHSLTNSLTDSCLVNLIDVTLACEDGNSKLVEVVTVVEVDDEKRVDNSLVQIWKVNFGHKVKFLFGL